MSGLHRHIRTELLKTATGRAALGSLLGGVFWCALSGYSYSSEAGSRPAELASGGVTGDIVRSWMMMLLFAAITCAMIVTRDFSHRTMSRTVAAYGGRTPVFLSKLVAAAAVAVVHAAVAVAGAAVTYLVAAHATPALAWTGESTRTLLGVAAAVLLAGLWGLMAGWLVRQQTLTVLGIVVLVVGVEPGVQRLVPGVARFLFSIALSGVYRDTKADLLPVGAAVGVSLLWIAVFGAVGRFLLSRRDIR